MKEKVYDILKGKFLIADDAIKNWRMLFFLSFLAIVMIASSHNAERKVHDIANLHDEVRELRTYFVDGRSELMRLKMESGVRTKMAAYDIHPADNPPTKIVVRK